MNNRAWQILLATPQHAVELKKRWFNMRVDDVAGAVVAGNICHCQALPQKKHSVASLVPSFSPNAAVNPSTDLIAKIS